MALELRTEPLAVRLRRDRPLQRQGMVVPVEAFAVTQKRKKVVTRKLYASVLLQGRKLFLYIFREKQRRMI